MFAVQLTGRLTKQSEQKDTKFGKASVYALETKNKKGELSYVNCIQYGALSQETAPKGSLVYVAGDMDVSQYMGKTKLNVLTRSFEVLEKAATENQIEESCDDEMPF
jgi:single-stranded DNA-binding protein